MDSEKTKAKRKNTFAAEDISMFCAQVSLILKSGITLHDGISAISENIKDDRALSIIGRIQEKVEVNEPFYEALNESGAFPMYMVNMVEIGEKSGKLDDVMEALSVYYNREEQLKKNIRSAILYPFILVLMMSAVIAILVARVLPIFTQVFNNLGGEMSALSTAVMNVGAGIAKYSFIVILAFAIVMSFILIYFKTKRGAVNVTKFFSRFGLTRKLSAEIASARFASVMSMMLSSGYSTDEALEMVTNVISNDLIKEKIRNCRKDISEGSSFALAITKAELFPGIYGQMISIGVKTGNLDSVMQKLADIYNDEADRSINKAISIIEPVLVGILSVIIGAILLSVMLPLMGIMSSIG